MEHNLEDPLALESTIGTMEFDHSGEVVSQEDIDLETTVHEPDIPMEFEHIEEQPMLMDTGNEEIIVSDFMNDQYTLQEYSVQDESGVETVTLDVSSFDADITTTVKQDINTSQTKYIAVKAPTQIQRKKIEAMVTSNMPRQVAIAPKPPKLVPTVAKGFTQCKQYAIAPKPVTLVANKGQLPASLVKKMSLANVIGGTSKSGNAVLTQIGKQFVMVPAGGGQKIKLVTSGSGMSNVQYVRSNNDQAELIKNVGGNTQKPVLTKVIMQGQSNVDSISQSAVITKIMQPTSSTSTPQTRYVMQQKTVPISIASNKVLLASPTKQGVKFAKKQIIAIKSPTPQVSTTKKVMITTNPNQNVILKTTAPPKSAQVSKDGSVVVQGQQKSQLHQINVPGKGIQYIRLITNQTPAPQKLAAKPQIPLALSSKSFVLTDTKGNVIQMSGEKMANDQPPPLLLSGNVGTTSKVTAKPQKKLVRIAPVAMKPAQALQQQTAGRSTLSLLAPLTPMVENTSEEAPVLIEERGVEVSEVEREETEVHIEQDLDSKAALRALIDDAVADDSQEGFHGMQEVEVEFERQETPTEDDSNSMDQNDSGNRSDEHPLIVIPSNFGKQQHLMKDDSNYSIEQDNVSLPYLSPRASQAVPEVVFISDVVSGELGLRPRKACNCTKSQCLKLYCDCFANGEFCNRCNCNNCHNNLENEELRQKAIRSCLDRNPNAFRPKIGKAKSGGPEIVRRHNKGCNCKRSGCLKNYCECFEAKIACTSMCKCVGCRNVEETLERRRDAVRLREKLHDPLIRPPAHAQVKQPCSFMTSEVIEAVCQCLVAAASDGGPDAREPAPDPLRDVIEEFARCLQDIISASHHSTALSLDHDGQA